MLERRKCINVALKKWNNNIKEKKINTIFFLYIKLLEFLSLAYNQILCEQRVLMIL